MRGQHTTYIGHTNQMLDDCCAPLRIFFTQDQVGDPIRNLEDAKLALICRLVLIKNAYLIASLDDDSDIIHILGLLLASSLKTFHGLDALIKLTLHEGKLTSKFQRFDIRKTQFFDVLRNDGWRRRREGSVDEGLEVRPVDLFAAWSVSYP